MVMGSQYIEMCQQHAAGSAFLWHVQELTLTLCVLAQDMSAGRQISLALKLTACRQCFW